MHALDASGVANLPHITYLSEVAALALAALVRLTTHKGAFIS